MSVEAGLSLHLYEYKFMDIIDCYLKCGLDVFGSDRRAYFVTSDDDSYDWEYLSVTYDVLKSVIERKERIGATIGIALFENGDEVTSLLKTEAGDLIIGCDINRRTLEVSGHRYTDANWYIEKFIAPLDENGIAVEGFKFWELR